MIIDDEVQSLAQGFPDQSIGWIVIARRWVRLQRSCRQQAEPLKPDADENRRCPFQDHYRPI